MSEFKYQIKRKDGPNPRHLTVESISNKRSKSVLDSRLDILGHSIEALDQVGFFEFQFSIEAPSSRHSVLSHKIPFKIRILYSELEGSSRLDYEIFDIRLDDGSWFGHEYMFRSSKIISEKYFDKYSLYMFNGSKIFQNNIKDMYIPANKARKVVNQISFSSIHQIFKRQHNSIKYQISDYEYRVIILEDILHTMEQKVDKGEMDDMIKSSIIYYRLPSLKPVTSFSR